MADEEIIDYIELARLATDLKKDIDQIKEDHLKSVRGVVRLADMGDSSVWVGSAASAFSAGFYDAFHTLFRLLTDELPTYQERLKKASEAYAMADRQAEAVAGNIEQAHWAEV